jgi:hypothetical protein
MECVLRLDSSLSNGTVADGEAIGNFGFTLQGASFASDVLMQPPVIVDRVFCNQVIVFLRLMVNN